MSDSNELKFVLNVDSATGLTSLKQFESQLSSIGDSGSRAGGRVVSGLNAMHAGAQNVKGPVAEIQSLLDRMQADKAEAAIAKLQKQLDITHDVATRLHAAMSSDDDPFKHAHLSAHSLEQELGIELPRAATAFLAESSLIGPMLGAAFSTIAVIGLIDALTQIPALFDKMKGSVTGWNDAEKKGYAELIADNLKLEDSAVQRQQKINAASPDVLGMTGAANKQAYAAAMAANRALADKHAKDASKEYEDADFAVREFDESNRGLRGLGTGIPITYRSDEVEEIERQRAALPALRARKESLAAESQAAMDTAEPLALTAATRARAFERLDYRGAEISGALSTGTSAASLAAQQRNVGLAGMPSEDVASKQLENEKALEKDKYDLRTANLAASYKKAQTLRGLDEAAGELEEKKLNDAKTASETDWQAKQIELENKGAAIRRSLQEAELHRTLELHSIQISGALGISLTEIAQDRSVATNRIKLGESMMATELLSSRTIAQRKLGFANDDIASQRKALDDTTNANVKAKEKEIADANELAQSADVADRDRAKDSLAQLNIDLLKLHMDHNTDVANLDTAAVIARANFTRDTFTAMERQVAATLGGAMNSAFSSTLSDIKSPHPNIYGGVQVNYSDVYSSRTGQLDPVKMELAMRTATQNGWGDFYLRGTGVMSDLAAYARHLFVDLGQSMGKSLMDSLSKYLTKQAFSGIASLISPTSMLGGMLGLGAPGETANTTALTGLTAAVEANTLAQGGSTGGGVAGTAVSGIKAALGLGGGGAAAAGGATAGAVDLGGTAGAFGAAGIDLGTVGAPAAGGIGGALGIGSGAAGLFGLGAATIPVLGGIALGVFGLYELFKHKVQVQMTPDPFAEIKALTVFFNTTMPFEKLTAALTASTAASTAVTTTMAGLSTMDPGQVMLDNASVLVPSMKAAVTNGLANDRNFRKAVSGPVLEQAI